MAPGTMFDQVSGCIMSEAVSVVQAGGELEGPTRALASPSTRSSLALEAKDIVAEM
jgi:hypothetical protein